MHEICKQARSTQNANRQSGTQVRAEKNVNFARRCVLKASIWCVLRVRMTLHKRSPNIMQNVNLKYTTLFDLTSTLYTYIEAVQFSIISAEYDYLCQGASSSAGGQVVEKRGKVKCILHTNFKIPISNIPNSNYQACRDAQLYSELRLRLRLGRQPNSIIIAGAQSQSIQDLCI